MTNQAWDQDEGRGIPEADGERGGGEEQESRALLPAGYYRARADKSTLLFGEAKTGNPQIAITFDIIDDKAAGYPNRITWIGTLAGGALTFTLDGIIAAGWTGTDLATLSAAEGVGDVECSLKIDHEENNETGKVYARVSFVNAARKAFAFKKGMDAGALANLGVALAGDVMAARERAVAKGGARPSDGGQSSHTATGGTIGGDFKKKGDIPF